MALQIEDGTGKSYGLGVTENHQARVQSESHELQHHISMRDGQVYQIIGGTDDVLSGTNTILHIRNDSSVFKNVVSFIRLQIPPIADATPTLPGAGTYFQIGRNTIRASGGIGVEPVNMNFSSGNIADMTVFKDQVTVSGTFVEFDRWYPSHDMMTFNKQGSLILGLNDTLEIRLVTDQAALTVAYCRVTIMLKKDGE
jgi:hypothetical protein